MRRALNIFAVLLAGMGIVWILQGVNILPGSFMTGQIVWAWRGAALLAVAVVLVLLVRRRGRR